MKKKSVTWSILNQRQQAYLKAIYQADQEVEASERATWSHGGRPRRASVWRWMPYATSYPGQMPMAVKKHISYTEKIDEGTGATLEALARRGLIKVKHFSAESLRHQEIISGHMGIMEPDPIPTIQLTPAGRKLVRQALDLKPAQRLPRGGLQEWHWRALAKAYAAREQGVTRDSVNYGRIGWNTWLRLKQYKVAGQETPLVEERQHSSHDWRMHLTPLGVAYYERSFARYRALYQEVDAPAPTQKVAADTPYIEHFQEHRRCLACRGAYLAHLTWTYQQHSDGTWSREEQEVRCHPPREEDAGEAQDGEDDTCRCQTEELREQRSSFSALLDDLEAQGWLVRCAANRHPWFDYLPYLLSHHKITAYVASPMMREALVPLFERQTDIEDARNIALLAEGLYVFNERAGVGTYYAIFAGKVNYIPLLRTRGQSSLPGRRDRD